MTTTKPATTEKTAYSIAVTTSATTKDHAETTSSSADSTGGAATSSSITTEATSEGSHEKTNPSQNKHKGKGRTGKKPRGRRLGHAEHLEITPTPGPKGSMGGGRHKGRGHRGGRGQGGILGELGIDGAMLGGVGGLLNGIGGPGEDAAIDRLIQESLNMAQGQTTPFITASTDFTMSTDFTGSTDFTAPTGSTFSTDPTITPPVGGPGPRRGRKDQKGRHPSDGGVTDETVFTESTLPGVTEPTDLKLEDKNSHEGDVRFDSTENEHETQSPLEGTTGGDWSKPHSAEEKNGDLTLHSELGETSVDAPHDEKSEKESADEKSWSDEELVEKAESTENSPDTEKPWKKDSAGKKSWKNEKPETTSVASLHAEGKATTIHSLSDSAEQGARHGNGEGVDIIKVRQGDNAWSPKSGKSQKQKGRRGSDEINYETIDSETTESEAETTNEVTTPTPKVTRMKITHYATEPTTLAYNEENNGVSTERKGDEGTNTQTDGNTETARHDSKEKATPNSEGETSEEPTTDENGQTALYVETTEDPAEIRERIRSIPMKDLLRYMLGWLAYMFQL